MAAEELVSRMRCCFERTVSKELGIPDRYKSAAMLIVRWAEHLDEDLKCWEEVSLASMTDEQETETYKGRRIGSSIPQWARLRYEGRSTGQLQASPEQA